MAKAMGFFRDMGVAVSFLSPHVDNYKATPASKVADRSADFAIAPSETIISYNTQPAGSQKPKLQVCEPCPKLLAERCIPACLTLCGWRLHKPIQLHPLSLVCRRLLQQCSRQTPLPS